MRIDVSGDFNLLEKLERKLRKAKDALAATSERLAAESLELVNEGIDSSTDPYGKKWPPLVLGEGPPLATLKGSWTASSVGADGFTIASSRRGSFFAQSGTGLFGSRHARIVPVAARALKLPGTIFVRSTKGEPVRKMVPDEGSGLPPRWRDRLRSKATDVLSNTFRP